MKPSRMAVNRNGKQTFTINADASDLDAFIDSLDADLQEAARPAAQAAAEVLYQAVRQNVSALGQKTGNLYGSIYQAFSPENSGLGRATYHVSWRTSGGGVRAPHGHLIEYGHIQKYKAYLGKDGHWYTNKKAPLPAPVQIAARPFIRPAAALFPQAYEAAKAKLLEALGAKA